MRKHFKMVNVVNHSISIERPRSPQLHECGIPNCRESEFISHTQPVTVRFSWNSPRLNMSGSVLEAWEGGTSKQFAWVSSKRRNWVVPFYLNWIELNCWNVRRRRRHGHVEGQGATNAFSPKSKHSLPLVVYIFFVIKFTFIYFYMTYNNTNDAHQKRKKQHKWSSHILDAPRITSSTLLFVFRENLLWILSLLIT